MKNILGALVVIGIGVLVYNQYNKHKKELKKVQVKKDN
jgi:hypothetical protein